MCAPASRNAVRQLAPCGRCHLLKQRKALTLKLPKSLEIARTQNHTHTHRHAAARIPRTRTRTRVQLHPTRLPAPHARTHSCSHPHKPQQAHARSCTVEVSGSFRKVPGARSQLSAPCGARCNRCTRRPTQRRVTALRKLPEAFWRFPRSFKKFPEVSRRAPLQPNPRCGTALRHCNARDARAAAATAAPPRRGPPRRTPARARAPGAGTPCASA